MDERDRKERLRAFLKDRRSRLRPSDVGLPEIGMRRCPGLRRQEVAELANISATWYTLFEMARDRRVSLRMVERVADALRLDDRDRGELFALAIPQFARTAAFSEFVRHEHLVGTVETFGTLATRLRETRTTDEALDAMTQAIGNVVSPDCRLFATKFERASIGKSSTAFSRHRLAHVLAYPTIREALTRGDIVLPDDAEGQLVVPFSDGIRLRAVVVLSHADRSWPSAFESRSLDTIAALMLLSSARSSSDAAIASASADRLSA